MLFVDVTAIDNETTLIHIPAKEPSEDPDQDLDAYVDDEPVPLAAFLHEFADRLNAPESRRVPAWLARLFVGENRVRLLSSSIPTTNERFKEAFDWEPRFPTYRGGLVDEGEKRGECRE